MAGTFITLPLTGASPFWGNSVSTAASLPAVGDVTGEVLLVLDTATLYYWDGAAWQAIVDGLADVSGPASSTSNALARFNGTTGKVIKNSAVTVDDSGNIVTAGTVDGVDVSSLPSLISTAQTTANNAQTAADDAQADATQALSDAAAAQVDADQALVDADAAQATADDAVLDAAAAQATANLKITGPGSATDNAVTRYDGTTGKLAKNSGVTIDDSANLEGVARVNATTAKLGGTGAAATSAVLELAGTTGALLLTRLTAVQRNALTPTNGMIIYLSDTDRFQGYFAGSWQNLHGWGD